MQKHLVLLPFLGLSLLGGCTREERVQRHEQAASDNLQKAHEEIATGRQNASEEMAKAADRARDDYRAAHDEKIKADEERRAAVEDRPLVRSDREERPLVRSDRLSDEATGVYARQRVAGHDPVMLGPKLRDTLGDDWAVVERPSGAFIATRVKMKSADGDLMKKVQDEIMSLREKHSGMTAAYRHEVVTLKGRAESCDDAAKRAHDFAKIDGINRIVMEADCVVR